MIRASAPGKLFIAGEYAVVNPGYPAVLVAVNRFITVTITESHHEGTIISEQYQHLPLKWKRVNNQFVIEKRENPFHYIVEAIKIVEEYALELNKTLSVYNLHVASQLDNESGAKYGLGSSGTVTIATIKALLRYYEIKEDDYLIYKLASLAHLNLGSNGSFGDLAASIMTGWIAYQSFDRQWVLDKRKEVSLSELLKLKWPSLRIEKLSPLSHYDILIGWTQSPASTPSLVDKVKRESHKKDYQEFLSQSQQIVSEMIEGFNNNDGEVVSQKLIENRQLLKSLNPSIETNALKLLIESAQVFGAAKSSGAGGGDCGIVLVKKDVSVEKLIQLWQQHNIEKLNIKVYDKHNLEKGMEHYES
ncbi:MAG: phosphomevalonate kinase [Erysipelothrix sp.]|nr:phosphomevalonate kinase [Erysipelothrix sp.]